MCVAAKGLLPCRFCMHFSASPIRITISKWMSVLASMGSLLASPSLTLSLKNLANQTLKIFRMSQHVETSKLLVSPVRCLSQTCSGIPCAARESGGLSARWLKHIQTGLTTTFPGKDSLKTHHISMSPCPMSQTNQAVKNQCNSNVPTVANRKCLNQASVINMQESNTISISQMSRCPETSKRHSARANTNFITMSLTRQATLTRNVPGPNVPSLKPTGRYSNGKIKSQSMSQMSRPSQPSNYPPDLHIQNEKNHKQPMSRPSRCPRNFPRLLSLRHF